MAAGAGQMAKRSFALDQVIDVFWRRGKGYVVLDDDVCPLEVSRAEYLKARRWFRRQGKESVAEKLAG